MSVTMHLYKVNPDVEYKGYYMDYLRPSDFDMQDGVSKVDEIEKKLGAPNINDSKAYNDWSDKMECSAWSDNRKHKFFSYTDYKSMFSKFKSWHRLSHRLHSFPLKVFNNGRSVIKYLAIDEVCYAQGWFFKNRFFNRKPTLVWCTTKEQMKNFFDRYIDFSKNPDEIYNILDNFMDKWDEGMLFECAW